MGYTAKELIAVAKAEVGYLEKETNKDLDSKTGNAGDENYTKYARDLHKAGYYNGNKNGYAWCDVFHDHCHWIAAGKDAKEAQRVICQTGLYGASCTFSSQYYKDAGRFYKTPKVGDQIFFYNSQKTEVAHTGIVTGVDDTYVYTIEGNTSGASGVVANGGGVCEKKYKLNYGRIYGYGRPRYDEEKPATTNNTTSKKATDAAKSYLKSLAGTYKVTASALNVRNGAGITKKNMVTIPKGTQVNNYGFYSTALGVKWLYIQFTYKGVQYTGFASSKYLKK